METSLYRIMVIEKIKEEVIQELRKEELQKKIGKLKERVYIFDDKVMI